jgi:glutamate-5-semialdehyde dehydrogenase
MASTTAAPIATDLTAAAGTVADTCAAAKRAARVLARCDTAVKDAALAAIARALRERTPEILAANQLDVRAGEREQIGDALLDRLRLDEGRIEGIARAVEGIAALPDPVGELIEGRRLPNGLDLRKVRVPLGVVAVVYEARPNVTVDAAALALKSGNAIVLRGSSTARHSNAVLAEIVSAAAVGAGLPEGCVSLVAGGGREELAEIATQTATVDLIIPRGGEGLKAALQAVATVPVIYAASGNCHIYVDAAADLEQALAIVLNAKVQRPGVCNAAETLLVHEQLADEFLPLVLESLGEAGVTVRAGADAIERAGGDAAAASQQLAGALVEPATEEDFATEYLAPILAVGIVGGLDQALEHIARHGSGHSEAIVTRDASAAAAFRLGVDAACVYVNASTRFTDGGEFGMGAEIGNSTQKLHARGPIGLRELCTFKYIVEGDGHVRP